MTSKERLALELEAEKFVLKQVTTRKPCTFGELVQKRNGIPAAFIQVAAWNLVDQGQLDLTEQGALLKHRVQSATGNA